MVFPFNVVVVFVAEWWNHPVVRGFYTVVVVLSVVPNQTRDFSSHWDSTILHAVVSGVSKKETDPHVEGNPDHCESVEDGKALDPFFTHQKYLERV